VTTYIALRLIVSQMVLVFLGNLQFEASKFETRTMPTPTMKGKEMIYWIKVETSDRRLVTDLERFLNGSSQFIELRVPSSFIAARTELESYIPLPPHYSPDSPSGRAQKGHSGVESDKEEQEEDTVGRVKRSRKEREPQSMDAQGSLDRVKSSGDERDQGQEKRVAEEEYGEHPGEEKYTLEIILRRNIPDQPTGKTQSPYG